MTSVESKQSQSDKSNNNTKTQQNTILSKCGQFYPISGFTTAPEQMCGAAQTDQFTCLHVPVDGRRTFLGSSDLTWSIFTTGEGRMVARGATKTQM